MPKPKPIYRRKDRPRREITLNKPMKEKLKNFVIKKLVSVLGQKYAKGLVNWDTTVDGLNVLLVAFGGLVATGVSAFGKFSESFSSENPGALLEVDWKAEGALLAGSYAALRTALAQFKAKDADKSTEETEEALANL